MVCVAYISTETLAYLELAYLEFSFILVIGTKKKEMCNPMACMSVRANCAVD